MSTFLVLYHSLPVLRNDRRGVFSLTVPFPLLSVSPGSSDGPEDGLSPADTDATVSTQTRADIEALPP